MGVAGDGDDLHAIAQRPGDGVEHVGGADEHHPGQVEGQIEIVVAETAVLLRVQDLEHGAGGVASPVGTHLVDLVDHEDGVAAACVSKGSDDGPGHGAHVRTAVAADLGLVAHSADADADELSAHGPGDALAQAGLAHSGRAREAQYGTGDLALQLLHGQELQDAVLHILQVVVVLVEYGAGVGDVEVVVRER